MVAEPTNRPEPRYGSATIPKLLMGAQRFRIFVRLEGSKGRQA
jgi:hypothetical protein